MERAPSTGRFASWFYDLVCACKNLKNQIDMDCEPLERRRSPAPVYAGYFSLCIKGGHETVSEGSVTRLLKGGGMSSEAQSSLNETKGVELCSQAYPRSPKSEPGTPSATAQPAGEIVNHTPSESLLDGDSDRKRKEELQYDDQDSDNSGANRRGKVHGLGRFALGGPSSHGYRPLTVKPVGTPPSLSCTATELHSSPGGMSDKRRRKMSDEIKHPAREAIVDASQRDVEGGGSAEETVAFSISESYTTPPPPATIPMDHYCAKCNRTALTQVDLESTVWSCGMCLGLFCFCGWLAVCVAPFLWPLTQVAVHRCPGCKSVVASRSRVSCFEFPEKIVTLRFGTCALILSRRHVLMGGGFLGIVLLLFLVRWVIQTVGFPDIAKGPATALTWNQFLADCGGRSLLGNPIKSELLFDELYASKTVRWSGRVHHVQEGFLSKHFLYLDMEPPYYPRNDYRDMVLIFGTPLLGKVGRVDSGDRVAFEATLLDFGRRGRPHLGVLWDLNVTDHAKDLLPVEKALPPMLVVLRQRLQSPFPLNSLGERLQQHLFDLEPGKRSSGKHRIAKDNEAEDVEISEENESDEAFDYPIVVVTGNTEARGESASVAPQAGASPVVVAEAPEGPPGASASPSRSV